MDIKKSYRGKRYATSYSGSYKDATYANIAAQGKPGYFTDISMKP